MRNCRSIRHLLYLYREGELTDRERVSLNQHVDSCPRCAAILKDLTELNGALIPQRTGTPELKEASRLNEQVIRQITGSRRVHAGRRPTGLEAILRWTGPAFGTLVISSVALLIVQQVHDAVKLSELEHRLQERGAISAPSLSARTPDDLQFLNEKTISEGAEELFPKPAQSADVGVQAAEFLRLAFIRMLGADNGMFARIAQRYPHLARINPEDGLDESERKILLTEGKAFLKEFESLVQQGEK